MGMITAQIHSSGHASQGELREIIAAIRPKVLIPIHTEVPELFRSLVEPVSPATKLINGVTNVPINL
jgi:mRNA degradation ribonuclease J1/J2